MLEILQHNLSAGAGIALLARFLVGTFRLETSDSGLFGALESLGLN